MPTVSVTATGMTRMGAAVVDPLSGGGALEEGGQPYVGFDGEDTATRACSLRGRDGE